MEQLERIKEFLIDELDEEIMSTKQDNGKILKEMINDSDLERSVKVATTNINEGKISGLIFARYCIKNFDMALLGVSD